MKNSVLLTWMTPLLCTSALHAAELPVPGDENSTLVQYALGYRDAQMRWAQDICGFKMRQNYLDRTASRQPRGAKQQEAYSSGMAYNAKMMSELTQELGLAAACERTLRSSLGKYLER